MRTRFKRLTAAGLIAVLLVGGFLAEYTHRHAGCAAEAAMASADNQSAGKTNVQLAADKCLLCQVAQQAISSHPLFGVIGLDLQGEVSSNHSVAPLLQGLHFSFQLRAPPSLLS
jgi:hypothetical protein